MSNTKAASAFSEKSEAMKGVIFTEVRIECGFVERMSILFGAPICVKIVTRTEHEPGKAHSESTTFIERERKLI